MRGILALLVVLVALGSLFGARAADGDGGPTHPHDEGACVLRLDLDPTTSSLEIGGSVVTPLSIPITQTSPSAGLFGAMYVQVNHADLVAQDSVDAIPVGECPEDGLSVLSEDTNTTFRFVSPPDVLKQDQLRVWPTELDVEVKLAATTFADLTFHDLALEILTYDFVVRPDPNGANASVFEVEALWRVQSGIGSAVSMILGPGGGRTYVDMAGLNTTVTMAGTFDWEGRKVHLNSVVSAGFDLKDGDIADGVTAAVAFDTVINADGVLGCPESCMLHGKCVPLGTNSSEFGCQCECGWSGPSCDVPSGYCGAFPSANATSVIYQSAPAATSTTWGGGNDSSAVDEYLAEAKSLKEECDLKPEDCGDHRAFNENFCSCECQVGWAGADCHMCTNNAACQIEELGEECDNSLVYSNKTSEKEYSCYLRESDPVRDFLQGDIRATCVVEEHYCSIRLGSFSDSQPHIQCNVMDCAFTQGSGHVNCNDLGCQCHPILGCPDYIPQEIIDVMQDAQGLKAGVLCDWRADEQQWVCEVSVEGLPVTVEGICTQGKCISGEENVKVDAAPLDNVSPPGLLLALAGILGGVLLALALFFLSTNLCRMHLKKVLAKHGRYGGSAVSNLLLPGSTFTFTNIKCVLASDQSAKVGNKVAPLLNRILHPRKASGESKSTASSGSFELSGTQRSRAESLRSMHSHGANHCSLEKFPDEIKTIRVMSDSDLFKNLDHVSRGGKKTILHSISGGSQKGLVMAIMGPSGSGKSTLLNILAGGNSQINNCKISGLIQIDGQPRDQWFSKIAAHVPQEDNQIPTLTVRECVMYSAMLRLPWHWEKREKVSHVDQVLKELGLKKVADSQVGGSGGAIRGVSGGERRRVSIGMELVTSPKILFLDEPTSGLDSYTAASIMSTLTRLARNGRMVFLSLHQPSEAVFKELDKILLLARGHAVYCGDASTVHDYFADMGFPCPAESNIADHILEVVSKYDSCEKLVRGSKSLAPAEDDCSAQIRVAIDKAEAGVNVNMEIVPVKRTRSQTAFVEVDMTPSTRAVLDLSPTRKGNLVAADSYQPLDSQLVILFWRTWTDILRHPALLKLHLVVSILVGAATALIFQNVPNDLAGIQNRAGCIFFTLTFFAFGSLTSIDLFISERAVFTRETQGGYYRVGTYFFAKAVLDGLLLRVLPAVLYSVIMYWAIGLRNTPSHVCVFFATLALFNLAAGALSMVIATVSPTAGFASLATIVALLVGLLFGGFLANADALPPWLSWMQYCSIFFYGFEVLFTNEISGLVVNFDAAGLNVNVKGDLFLDTFNFSPDDLSRDIIALFAIYVCLLILAYLLLAWKANKSDINVQSNENTEKKGFFSRLAFWKK